MGTNKPSPFPNVEAGSSTDAAALFRGKATCNSEIAEAFQGAIEKSGFCPRRNQMLEDVSVEVTKTATDRVRRVMQLAFADATSVLPSLLNTGSYTEIGLPIYILVIYTSVINKSIRQVIWESAITAMHENSAGLQPTDVLSIALNARDISQTTAKNLDGANSDLIMISDLIMSQMARLNVRGQTEIDFNMVREFLLSETVLNFLKSIAVNGHVHHAFTREFCKDQETGVDGKSFKRLDPQRIFPVTTDSGEFAIHADLNTVKQFERHFARLHQDMLESYRNAESASEVLRTTKHCPALGIRDAVKRMSYLELYATDFITNLLDKVGRTLWQRYLAEAQEIYEDEE